MKLEYTKIDGYIVHSPERGSTHAAGIDIFVPEFNAIFLTACQQKVYFHANKGQLHIPVGGSIIIPTGLRFVIPEGTYLEVKNRSSIAAKKGLICGACVIDSDYTGEVFINLINTSTEIQTVLENDKIAQLIHKEYLHSDLTYIKPEEYTKETERGAGCLGSTN